MKLNRIQMRNMIPENQLPGKIIRMKKISIQYLVILELENEYRTCNLYSLIGKSSMSIKID